eukprot:scaffold193652_cov14-Tisochrysis_lutea.AAC.1
MDKIKRSLPKGVLCDGKQSRAPVIAYSCCLDQVGCDNMMKEACPCINKQRQNSIGSRKWENQRHNNMRSRRRW